MDIEELSKAQLLLLTVMVNFVVSIATGILTVSFLDQGPVMVTQGVNRIVERTIENIATPIPVTNPIKSITSPQIPAEPVPTEEDKLTGAVGDALARSVLIHRSSTTTPAIAFGTYLPSSRAIVTAAVQGLPREALVQFSNGTAARASISRSSKDLVIYGFANDAVLPDAPVASLVKETELKQGQTVIAITKDSAAIAGIISKVDVERIATSLVGVPAGGGIVDLEGRVVAIGSVAAGVSFPASAVQALLQSPVSTR